MKVLVFGAGSLGSLVGGLLARTHDVCLVGRDPHLAEIRAHGLRVEGDLEFTVRPQTALEAPGSTDLALVTVKAFDTPEAARALAATKLDGVVSLQNGLGNEETLAARLDAPVMAGTCTYGAFRPGPGRVECTGNGEVVVGPYAGGQSDVSEWIGDAFESAGVQTTVAPDMPRRLWEKLAVNCGINAPTSLARVENGALFETPVATVAETAAREAANVARAEGISLRGEAAVAETRRVAGDTGTNRSSMLQDVRAGRRTEIDAINGFVADHDEPTPVNDTLARLVQSWEVGNGIRD